MMKFRYCIMDRTQKQSCIHRVYIAPNFFGGVFPVRIMAEVTQVFTEPDRPTKDGVYFVENEDHENIYYPMLFKEGSWCPIDFPDIKDNDPSPPQNRRWFGLTKLGVAHVKKTLKGYKT